MEASLGKKRRLHQKLRFSGAARKKFLDNSRVIQKYKRLRSHLDTSKEQGTAEGASEDPVDAPPPTKKPRLEKEERPCKFFNRGNCVHGDKCIYKHDTEMQQDQDVCKFFLKGKCRRGKFCPFSHPKGQQVLPQSLKAAMGRQKVAEPRISKEERAAQVKEKQEARRRTRVKLTQRSARGQPVMKNVIKHTLGKILKTLESEKKDA